MINYSIIIPHKNIPDLLTRCVNSIPQRGDIQIIVVDDNSDQAYLDIFPSFYRSDLEVIFTKEGRGAGYARNIGLKRAKGKWLLFADADDYYTDGFLDVLDKYKETDIDVVYFRANKIHDSSIHVGIDSHNDHIFSYLENPVAGSFILRLRYWEPWDKLFRREYIVSNNFLFEEIQVGNDAMFVVKSGYYASHIKADPFPLYNYVIRPGSLTTAVNNEKLLIAFKLHLRLNNFYRSIHQKQFMFGYFSLYKVFLISKDGKLLFVSFVEILKHRQFLHFVYSFLLYSRSRFFRFLQLAVQKL